MLPAIEGAQKSWIVLGSQSVDMGSLVRDGDGVGGWLVLLRILGRHFQLLPTIEQGPTKFFAAYKQISLIGSVPTKFTINSTTNWGLCLQAALACSPTLSDPGALTLVSASFHPVFTS